jgi:hypothetical protein
MTIASNMSLADLEIGSPEREANEILMQHYAIIMEDGEDLADEILVSILAKQHALFTIRKLKGNAISSLSGQERNPFCKEFWIQVEELVTKM